MTKARAVVVLVAAIVFVIAVIVLLPGEPCAEFNGWRWVQIWPRPDHCQ